MNRARVVAWGVGVVCVAAAWGVGQVLPAEDAAQAPFTVPIEIGEHGEGRALSATVTDVVLADELVSGAWRMPAKWLVVDLIVEGHEQESGSLLSHAVLVVDDRQYRATERAPDTLLRAQLAVDIAQRGSLAFELPEETGGTVQLQLARQADPRLDSMIVLDIDLDDLQRSPERRIAPVEWVRP